VEVSDDGELERGLERLADDVLGQEGLLTVAIE